MNNGNTAIIFSLEKEVVFFKQQVEVLEKQGLNQGELLTCRFQGRQFYLAKAGVGGRKVIATLAALVKTINLQRIILTGYAGSADPQLPVGKVIIPEKVIALDGTLEKIPVAGVVSLSLGADYRSNVTLRTVPGLTFKKDKERLRREYGANLAVDMESGFCATWAREQGIKFAAIKAISDGYDAVLPSAEFVAAFFERKQQGPELVKQLLRHPIQFRRLVKLNKGCVAAAKALSRILGQILSGNGQL